jgi:hypothetical protein
MAQVTDGRVECAGASRLDRQVDVRRDWRLRTIAGRSRRSNVPVSGRCLPMARLHLFLVVRSKTKPPIVPKRQRAASWPQVRRIAMCATSLNMFSNASGAYGCCPYPQATCCSDQVAFVAVTCAMRTRTDIALPLKIHCCANGYTCDQTGQRCTRHLTASNHTESRSSARKLPSLTKADASTQQRPVALLSRDEQVCADGKTRCAASSTCCPNGDVSPLTYACCPYAQVTCSTSRCAQLTLSCSSNARASAAARTALSAVRTITRATTNNSRAN